MVAAAATGLVATAGLAVVQASAGRPLDLLSVFITLKIIGAIAMLTSLPMAAVASVLRQVVTPSVPRQGIPTFR